MALSGTLSDLGIVDLIQFPSAGHKTGELIVSGVEEEARLYFAKGNLQHISIGQLQGMDALVEVISWDKGEFEFRVGVEQKEKSLNIDLHQALMFALKTRDEKAAMDKRKPTDGNNKNDWKQGLKHQFQEYLSANPYFQGICLLAEDGNAIVEIVKREAFQNEIEKIKKFICQIKENYPRSGFSRMLLDGDAGIVCSTCLPDKTIVLIVTSKEASLGAVSVNASKLTALIEGMKR